MLLPVTVVEGLQSRLRGPSWGSGRARESHQHVAAGKGLWDAWGWLVPRVCDCPSSAKLS